MKRISLVLVLLALTPAIGRAYGYGSYYCSTRYSPYALSYRSSGLVSCGVDYTPYATSYRNSGLVPGYGTESYGTYAYPVIGRQFKGTARPAFRGSRAVHRRAQDTPKPVRPQDGMEVIRRHLLAKGITSVTIDRILRIDNQLVSVDILVPDRHLLIKYWNPEAIEGLPAKEGFKQKAYENYRQNWTRIAAQHEQHGGEIYRVEASDAQTIVAALDSCTGLDPGLKSPDRIVLYAKN